MNFIVNVLILVLLSLAIFPSRGYSQTSFAGNYKFFSREHVKGPEYGNGVPTSIAIEQTKDSVIISQGSIENDVPTKNRIPFANNGKPVQTKSKSSGRKLIRSVKWAADKQSFTTTTEIYKDGSDNQIELTRIDDYKLSADGKNLFFHRRSVETVTESWEDNATYNKH